MKNHKISSVFYAFVIAMILFCNKAEAQVNAQSDLFSTLESTCNNYLDVVANDNLGGLQFDSLRIITQPQNGVAFVNDSFLGYCPDSGYLGADHFRYVVYAGPSSDTANLYLNVLPSNDSVFPGDADQNGKVENFDVLAIGLAYELKGPSRDSFSVNALAWSPSSFTNANPGAADCNGDGIVDRADLVQVETAYHDTFPNPSIFDVPLSECHGNGVPFYIESLSGDSVFDGDTLDIVIKLGNDLSANEAYGIAFTLEFDNQFISGDSIQFFTSQTWLFQNDTGLFFNRSFQADGEMEIAITRTDHLPALGGGDILYARVPIDDNIDGIISAPGWHDLDLRLNRTRLVSPYNVLRDICMQQPALKVYKMLSGIKEGERHILKIYPNPASDLLLIEAENIREVEMTDVTGRKVYALQTESTNKIQINTKHLSLARGTYFVRIKTNGFVSTQKIFVHH